MVLNSRKYCLCHSRGVSCAATNILSNDDHNGVATLQAQSIPMVVESVLAVRVKWAAVVTLADSDLRSVGGGNRWGDEVLSCLQWKWVANYGWQWADDRMTVRDMLS